MGGVKSPLVTALHSSRYTLLSKLHGNRVLHIRMSIFHIIVDASCTLTNHKAILRIADFVDQKDTLIRDVRDCGDNKYCRCANRVWQP